MADIIRTFTCGVKFRPGFQIKMIFRQSSMDRFVWNRFLQQLKDDFAKMGGANCSRNRVVLCKNIRYFSRINPASYSPRNVESFCRALRVNKWYTELRNSSGTRFLRGQVSSITRARLYELAHHFALYQKTQYELAYDKTPDTIFVEPKFRHRCSWKVSLPLVFTRDNTVGPAKFVSGRDIRISKFGNLRISRPIPDGYEPRTARLIYDKDRRWRLVIQCKVRDNAPPPEIPYSILGIDRNVGNVALSNGQIIEPPERVTDRLQQLQNTGERIQRKMARCKGPNRRRRTPGSNRYNKQARRFARNQRKIKDTCHTITHKKSRIIADTTKDVVLENLRTTNMTKSAKGTKENPGRNVAQKSGLNKSILGQNWYDLEQQVQYKIVGNTQSRSTLHQSAMSRVRIHRPGKSFWSIFQMRSVWV